MSIIWTQQSPKSIIVSASTRLIQIQIFPTVKAKVSNLIHEIWPSQHHTRQQQNTKKKQAKLSHTRLDILCVCFFPPDGILSSEHAERWAQSFTTYSGCNRPGPGMSGCLDVWPIKQPHAIIKSESKRRQHRPTVPKLDEGFMCPFW